MEVKKTADTITLLEPLTATTGTNALGSEVRLPRPPNGVTFLLVLTDAQDAVGDTLDVYVDTYIGGVWIPVVHFTQILGNGTNSQTWCAKSTLDTAETEFDVVNDALAAASHRNIAGDKWRARYTIVDGGGAHSFTFGVYAMAD